MESPVFPKSDGVTASGITAKLVKSSIVSRNILKLSFAHEIFVEFQALQMVHIGNTHVRIH